MKTDVEIIYEDNSIIAVNKPSGLATVRERSAAEGLAEILSEKSGNKVFTVHRLDKEASGIVLFAKNASAHRELSQQFEDRAVSKTYLGLAEGVIEDNERTIDLPISPGKKNRFKMCIDEKKGKKSVTHFTVQKRFLNYSLLKIKPETGRMHQIRLHLSAFGHPIVCDAIYGSKNPLYLSQIKRDYRGKEGCQERPIFSRLGLHAGRLDFTHPETGEPLAVRAEIPEDLRLALGRLEKYSLRK